MRAFALRADIKDFAGGQIALPPDGRTLDVGRRLAGKKYIVTSDAIEAEALAAFISLKELFGDELADAVAGGSGEPSKADLVDRAKELGLPTSGTKEELAARIAEADTQNPEEN